MSRTAKLQELLKNNPDDVFLNFGLAMELLKENRQEEAIAQFDRVLDLDPNYVSAYIQKGNALIRLGRKDQAKETLAAGIAAAKAAGDMHIADQAQRVLDTLP